VSAPVCVADYRKAARARLPRLLFDYIDGGAYAEATLAANTDDLAALKLRQRVLRDVSTVSLATELFGQTLSMPVVLAPVGLAGMFARRGETKAARAAKAAGTAFCLSTVGVCTIEEVAAAAGAPPWFQLYMIRDRGVMTDVLARARAAGCPVLVLTVDLPVPGVRYRDVRSGLALPPTPLGAVRRAVAGLSHPRWLWDVYLNGRPHGIGNLAQAIGAGGVAAYWPWIAANFDPRLTWKDLDWIRQHWSGPIVVKGVLDPDDAREARRIGVDGVVVSNHGGRQLDGAPSTIAALPAIAEAVGGDLAVLMDGGVRSGLDVVKALAAGAKACLIGRPWAWALGARGEAGVAHVLEVIRAEMLTALALTGCTDVRDAGPDLLA
jgi:L-lactate dehydrogenase (cytochrome)